MNLLKFGKLFLIFAASFTSSLSSQPNVYVDPPNQSVGNASIVIVNFKIFNVTNLRYYEVKFNFNDEILKYKSVTKGSFLSNGGSYTTSLLYSPTENITDHLTVNEAILGGGLSVTGSGTLFTVQFDLLSAGQSAITIESITLWDVSNNPMSGTFTSGNVNVLLSVNAKVYLQGPYNGTTMNTTLRSSSLLPSNQPYNSIPWLYPGLESVSPIPNNVVDWVLVELRTTTASSDMIARQAGLLLDNGLITGTDGSSPLGFLLPSGSYYIVIIHRNHLKIMSLNAVQLNFNSNLYDFSSAITQAFGSTPMVLLTGDVYGLYAGDTNSDGTINATDRTLAWNNRNTTGCYLPVDVSLDGQVNSGDRSGIWNNRNKSAQVP
jgi:hypothetical protein